VAESWESALERWTSAGVVDSTTAERVRQFESSRQPPRQLRWPILIAVAFGAIMVAAGVLLFVSAHWDELSPGQRFSLVLMMVGVFHVAGALFAERFSVLSTALHGIGTASLGAGIFLSAQIFNLQEHWPGGVMLWALGAWIAWALRRDWVQAALVALLTPAWLASEWIDASERMRDSDQIVGAGLLLLSITYLTALSHEQQGPTRRVLAWIGGIAMVPLTFIAIPQQWWGWNERVPLSMLIAGKSLGIVLPLALAWLLRSRASWMNGVAAIWVLALGFISPEAKILPYIWAALASFGMIAWGMYEARRERINLGILGFGLTVICFYFSNVMDKLGRSASLMGLGLLFLVLGWVLERTRRRLVAKVKAATA